MPNELAKALDTIMQPDFGKPEPTVSKEAYDACLAKLDQVMAENDNLRCALLNISHQQTCSELGDDAGFADFGGGYDAIIEVARAALKELS